jgi:hypothetical protein
MSSTPPDEDSGGKRNLRAHVRYAPDEGDFALIDPQADGAEFSPKIPALIASESYRGCGLVVMKNANLNTGDKIRLQVGKLPPLKAEVRWRMKVDAEIFRVGIMYLD